METKHKEFTLVHYCVGWNFDGPIYVTHFVDTRKPAKPKPNKKGYAVAEGYLKTNKVFKHKHNN